MSYREQAHVDLQAVVQVTGASVSFPDRGELLLTGTLVQPTANITGVKAHLLGGALPIHLASLCAW